MNNDLTARQQNILDYLRASIEELGYPPSVREIGEAVGLSSPSTVQSHLKTLEAKGYIKRDPSSARAITVIDVLEEIEGNHTYDDVDPYANAVSLPLIGQVAAGAPILAEENIEDYFVMPRSIAGDSSSFLLKVCGESMIEAGIFDGDYVVVEECDTARNGEIVVALIDDSATVKTFYRESGRIRLQPENSTMEPIYVTDLAIIGRVKGLFRVL